MFTYINKYVYPLHMSTESNWWTSDCVVDCDVGPSVVTLTCHVGVGEVEQGVTSSTRVNSCNNHKQ